MRSPLDQLLNQIGAPPILPPADPDPTFSVVVRTQAHRPDSLLEALGSISAQTRPPIETLVTVHREDEASTAEAVERVTSLLEHAEELGSTRWRTVAVVGGMRGRPLNAGLDRASGDYVVFLDDDDLARPRWLAAFAEGVQQQPGTIIRAVCLSQAWTTDGGTQPVRPTGELERPFADRFDLLAHLSHNETPICSIALPREGLAQLGIRFDESLPVFEDWELLVRAAMFTGVVSVPDETSIYRRTDTGNAFAESDESTWHRTHARVIEQFASAPVLLPPGAAKRLAAAHFRVDGTTDHQRRADAYEASPWWRATAIPRRLVTLLKAARSRDDRA